MTRRRNDAARYARRCWRTRVGAKCGEQTRGAPATRSSWAVRVGAAEKKSEAAAQCTHLVQVGGEGRVGGRGGGKGEGHRRVAALHPADAPHEHVAGGDRVVGHHLLHRHLVQGVLAAVPLLGRSLVGVLECLHSAPRHHTPMPPLPEGAAAVPVAPLDRPLPCLTQVRC